MKCVPVHPKELDIRSEDDSILSLAAWLEQMINDEFTDVNKGEKEMKKIWKCHMMHHGYVGDSQIPLACEMFVEQGKGLPEKNLFENFLMHLCNLLDYGIISPEDYNKSVLKLQKLLSDHDDGRQAVTEALEKQVDHWDKVGSQEQVQLIEQHKKIQVNAKGSSTATNEKTTTTTSTTEVTNKKELKMKLELNDEKLKVLKNLEEYKECSDQFTESEEGCVRIKKKIVIRSTLRECTRSSRITRSRRTPKPQ